MLTLTALAMIAALPAPPAPLDTVRITEWAVPYPESRPRDPFVDGQGRVWFVGQVGNYVAYFVPATKQFKRYELDPEVNPHNLIVARDGMVWYAGNRAAHIGKLDPVSGKVVKYPMPDPAARDPHTLVFNSSQTQIWFSVQGGNFVGRLDLKSGKVDLVKMTRDGARPYGIMMDAQDRPWFVEFGTNRIGTVDPKTMALKEYDLPNERSRPRRIALTSDGMVWYGDYTRGYLGRLDPKTGAVKEWANPSGATSLPYAMTMDDEDRVWFVETGVRPNRLVGFDPKTEQFFSNTPVLPSGGGTVRHMVFEPKTRSIWWGSDTNQLGRAEIRPVQGRPIP
jgi:virginiamycin B lyase